ncbi:MAG: alpha/beta hydrolase [Actinomycetia bacterium]|nr:alpha/beta hydrolase [Actinomycetes bacterium]
MRDGYADTPMGQVHYLTAGDGEPLVLLHKSPRSSRMYRKVIPLLAPYYTVYALDMLGYGYSHPSPIVDDVVLALAENIVQALDAFEIERAHVFGLHTGAAVSAEIAAGWPERIASLILFSFPILDEEAREVMQEVHRSYGGYKTWGSEGDGTHLTRLWIRGMDDVTRWLMHASGFQPPDGLKYEPRQLLTQYFLPNPARATHLWIHEIGLEYLDGFMTDFLLAQDAQGRGSSVYDSLYSRDPLPALGRIEAPTLLIEPDTPYEVFFTQTAARAVKLIKNAEILSLENSDDNVNWFDPPKLANAILDYVKRHPIAGGAVI